MTLLDKDRWNEIFETLTSNKVRTLLTAFGVFWGIFILIILLSAANGMKNGVMRDFGNIATNTMFCWTRPTAMPYKGMDSNRRFRYNLQDVNELRKIPELRYVVPRDMASAKISRKMITENISIHGDYPEYMKQESIIIEQGRFINYGDINTRRKICVISKGLVNSLYKEDNAIGSNVMINGINFLVIGIYKRESSDEEDEKNVYIPFTTFQQIYNTGEKVGWLALTAIDKVPITSIKSKIVDLLKKRHKVNPKDERAIGNFDLFEAYNKVSGLFSILSFGGYFVGFLVLITGVIGVGNIMLIVVKDKTKEIGIRRALGAQPNNIRLQILLESVVLTLLSGIVGIIFSTGVIYIANVVVDSMETSNIMFANPSVDLFTVLTALMILILSGALAGLLPAQAAIKVRPVEALRTE